MDEFHIFTPEVEFTNSYQDHVNSTSHFCAHFSGYIYNYKGYHTKIHDFYLKLYAFQNKILPPSGICSNRVEVILTMWN